jgi:hypothetical protein
MAGLVISASIVADIESICLLLCLQTPHRVDAVLTCEQCILGRHDFFNPREENLPLADKPIYYLHTRRVS